MKERKLKSKCKKGNPLKNTSIIATGMFTDLYAVRIKYKVINTRDYGE